MSFKMEESIYPAPGNYPGGTCSATTWSVLSPQLYWNFILGGTATISPKTVGSLTPCTPNVFNRTDSSTLTVKILPAAAVLLPINGNDIGSLETAASVAWKDFSTDGGTSNHVDTFEIKFNITSAPQSAIAAQALKWIGQSDSGFGAPCRDACVVTVNNVVHAATGKWLGGESTVSNVDPLRKNGDVTSISQADAIPGDFLIVDSANGKDGHIGICLNQGCSNVISNSSTHCTFTFESDDNARFSYTGSPYNDGTPSYWRAVLK
jgi:hypothetical protein